MPLKAAFLELFTIACYRDASVVDLMSCGNGTLEFFEKCAGLGVGVLELLYGFNLFPSIYGEWG